MEFYDKQLILFCAFRYALGRRTYVVSAMVDEIVNNWEYIPKHRQDQMKKEIKEHADLGMNCDIQEWNRILSL